MGWQKPTAPPRRLTWEDEVRALYERSPDMDVDEFEALLDVALRGHRPEHPDLPVFLAPRPGGLPTLDTFEISTRVFLLGFLSLAITLLRTVLAMVLVR